MRKLRFVVLAVSLVFSVTASFGAPENAEPRIRKTLGEEFFAQRSDLIKDIDFGKDPTVVPPRPITQGCPKLPKGLPAGTYRFRVAFIIEKNGQVKDAAIMKSSGVPALDKAHLEAVKKWKFKPMEYQGKKIPIATMQPFEVAI